MVKVNRRSEKRQRRLSSSSRKQRPVPPKRSMVFWLGTALRLFLAFRKVSRAQARAVETLRPAGLAGQRDTNVKAKERQAGRAAEAPQEIPAPGVEADRQTRSQKVQRE